MYYRIARTTKLELVVPQKKVHYNYGIGLDLSQCVASFNWQAHESVEKEMLKELECDKGTDYCMYISEVSVLTR